MAKTYYVGLTKVSRKFEVFVSADTPTLETHGHVYGAVIGPFRTKAGAEYMERCGLMNPHCQTVNDAERLAHLKGA